MTFNRSYAALLCLVVAGCSNPGQECFDRVKSELKDPSTATILEYDQFPMSGERITRVTIRASNGTGSYGNVYGMCKERAHRVTTDRLAFMPHDGWTPD